MLLFGNGHAADAVPFHFHHPVGRIGSPGEVVHVLGMVTPDSPLARIGQEQRRLFCLLGCLEIGQVDFLSPAVFVHLFRIEQGTGCFGHIMGGQIKFHIEGAEVAVELMFHVLLDIPAELAVVHADARIPVHGIEMLVTAVHIVHLHAAAHGTAVEPGIEIDMEAQAVARSQSEVGRKAHLQDGIVEPGFQLHPYTHQIARAAAVDAVHPGSEFLRFIFPPFGFHLVPGV